MCIFLVFSFQAAEKALKAARFLKHYEYIKTHNLWVIAQHLSNEKLQDLAKQLELLMISSSHLLYPNKWSIPKIPHDHYGETESRMAIELGKEILDIVYQEIYE